MGALPKPEPAFIIVDIDEVDGQQVVRLPAHLHLDAERLQVTREGTGLKLEPVRRPPTEDEFNRWVERMRAYQEELGDLFPEGRNQPPMPEPRDLFPDDFEDDQH